MFPFPSTVMPLPDSSLLPPRSVENNRPEPAAFNLVTNASVKKLEPVPAYKVDESLGRTTRVRTKMLHKPEFALVQLVPPFVDLIMPALLIAAYTAADVATIALTELFCGTSFVSGVHEAAPLVLLLMPPEPWPV